jgi:hypothetical protein
LTTTKARRTDHLNPPCDTDMRCIHRTAVLQRPAI